MRLFSVILFILFNVCLIESTNRTESENPDGKSESAISENVSGGAEDKSDNIEEVIYEDYEYDESRENSISGGSEKFKENSTEVENLNDGFPNEVFLTLRNITADGATAFRSFTNRNDVVDLQASASDNLNVSSNTTYADAEAAGINLRALRDAGHPPVVIEDVGAGLHLPYKHTKVDTADLSDCALQGEWKPMGVAHSHLHVGGENSHQVEVLQSVGSYAVPHKVIPHWQNSVGGEQGVRGDAFGHKPSGLYADGTNYGSNFGYESGSGIIQNGGNDGVHSVSSHYNEGFGGFSGAGLGQFQKIKSASMLAPPPVPPVIFGKKPGYWKIPKTKHKYIPMKGRRPGGYGFSSQMGSGFASGLINHHPVVGGHSGSIFSNHGNGGYSVSGGLGHNIKGGGFGVLGGPGSSGGLGQSIKDGGVGVLGGLGGSGHSIKGGGFGVLGGLGSSGGPGHSIKGGGFGILEGSGSPGGLGDSGGLSHSNEGGGFGILGGTGSSSGLGHSIKEEGVRVLGGSGHGSGSWGHGILGGSHGVSHGVKNGNLATYGSGGVSFSGGSGLGIGGGSAGLYSGSLSHGYGGGAGGILSQGFKGGSVKLISGGGGHGYGHGEGLSLSGGSTNNIGHLNHGVGGGATATHLIASSDNSGGRIESQTLSESHISSGSAGYITHGGGDGGGGGGGGQLISASGLASGDAQSALLIHNSGSDISGGHLVSVNHGRDNLIPEAAYLSSDLNRPSGGGSHSSDSTFSSTHIIQGLGGGNSLPDTSFLSTHTNQNFAVHGHGVSDDLSSSSTFTCGKNHDHNTNYHTATFQVADHDHPSSVDVLQYGGDGAVLIQSGDTSFHDQVLPERKHYKTSHLSDTEVSGTDNRNALTSQVGQLTSKPLEQETGQTEAEPTKTDDDEPERHSYYHEITKVTKIPATSVGSVEYTFSKYETKPQSFSTESETTEDEPEQEHPQIIRELEHLSDKFKLDLENPQKLFEDPPSQELAYHYPFQDTDGVKVEGVKEEGQEGITEFPYQFFHGNKIPQHPVVVHKKPVVKYIPRPVKPHFNQKTSVSYLQPKPPLVVYRKNKPKQFLKKQNYEVFEHSGERHRPVGEIFPPQKFPKQFHNPKPNFAVDRPKNGWRPDAYQEYKFDHSHGKKVKKFKTKAKVVAPILIRRPVSPAPVIRVVEVTG